MGLARNLFNLKRISRAAEQVGVELRLVTRHLSTRTLARDAGIYVHAGVPVRLLKYTRQHPPARQDLAGRVVPVRETLGRRWQHKPRVGCGAVLITLLGILVVVALLAAGAAALVPHARILVVPVAVRVSGEMTVTAVNGLADVDYGAARIPARLVSEIVSGIHEVPSTGQADVPAERASGEVVFVNRTTEPVTVPKGTVVRTGSGTNVRFYTALAAELPGALYANRRVPVIALDPGFAGNVRPLTINVVEGDLATRVEVLNDTPTTGGTVRSVALVKVDDQTRAFDEAPNRLLVANLKLLTDQALPGEFLVPMPVGTDNVLYAEVMSYEFLQNVGAQSDVTSINMKAVLYCKLVSGSSLEALVVQFLGERAPQGMGLIEDSLVITRSGYEKTDQVGAVRFQVQASGMYAPTIDAAAVKAKLRGVTVPQAETWLAENLALRGAPVVELTPAWWPYLPWLPARVDLVVSAAEELATTEAGGD
jgi:hypothetical protein